MRKLILTLLLLSCISIAYSQKPISYDVKSVVTVRFVNKTVRFHMETGIIDTAWIGTPGYEFVERNGIKRPGKLYRTYRKDGIEYVDDSAVLAIENLLENKLKQKDEIDWIDSKGEKQQTKKKFLKNRKDSIKEILDEIKKHPESVIVPDVYTYPTI